jgi:hypothetical protein
LEIERAKAKEAEELVQKERAKAVEAVELVQRERAKNQQLEQQVNLVIQNLLDQPDWSDARIAATFQITLEHIHRIRSLSKG